MVWNQKSLLSYFCPAPQGRRKFLFFFFFFNALVQNFPGATWHLWATPHFTIFCHYGINVWVCSISKYIKTKQSKKPPPWVPTFLSGSRQRGGRVTVIVLLHHLMLSRGQIWELEEVRHSLRWTLVWGGRAGGEFGVSDLQKPNFSCH